MAVVSRDLVADLEELAGRAAPVSLAVEQRLAVLPPLEPLLPSGLRRGSVTVVEGSSSLALSLAAAASAGGSWCAAVGRPGLGLSAASQIGIALERFPVVPAPDPAVGAAPGGWAWVVATLLDSFDVVLAWPPANSRATVRSTDARRLVARARERGSVLVVVASTGWGLRAWPVPPDVRMSMARSEWVGAGDGHGRLLGRRVDVVAGGRGAADRERRAALWLPAPGGGIAPAQANDTDPALRDVG